MKTTTELLENYKDICPRMAFCLVHFLFSNFSGLDDDQIKLIKQLDLKYNFILSYQLKKYLQMKFINRYIVQSLVLMLLCLNGCNNSKICSNMTKINDPKANFRVSKPNKVELIPINKGGGLLFDNVCNYAGDILGSFNNIMTNAVKFAKIGLGYTLINWIGKQTAFADGLIGSVHMYSVSNIPEGYLECNGSEYKMSDYPELYNLIAETYDQRASKGEIYFKVS